MEQTRSEGQRQSEGYFESVPGEETRLRPQGIARALVPSGQDTASALLLAIPPELLIKIILFLPSSDILACKLTNKYLHELIKGSYEIEYHTELLYCGAEDNSSVTLPLPQKLHAIRRTERAWSEIQPTFTTSTDVPEISAKWYDIMDGMFWWSGYGQSFIHYLKLPDKEDDKVVWRKFQWDKPIVSFTVCIYEQDLIAIVTTNPVLGEAGLVSYNVDLHLLQFSTGKAHPKARESCIHLMDSRTEEPMEFMQAVGEHLTFIGTTNDGLQDQILVLNWQTNEVKMSWLVPSGRYLGHRFLTTDLLVFANQESLSIDIFRIPSTPDLSPHVPILVLDLPRISDGYSVESFHLCVKPNPRKEHMRKAPEYGTYVPDRSYLANPDDAIFIFRLQVDYCFTFVVHRKALVDLVEKYGSPTHVDGSGHCATVSEFRDGNSRPRTDSGGEGQQVDGNQPTTNPPATQAALPTLPYSVWGPSVTRWFSSSRFRMVLTTWGQRHVQINLLFDDVTPSLLVLDFNPARVKTFMTRKKATTEDDRGEASGSQIIQGDVSEPQEVENEAPEPAETSEPQVIRGEGSISEDHSSPFVDGEEEEDMAHPEDDIRVSDSEDDATSHMPVSPSQSPETARTWCISSCDLLEPAEIFAEPVFGGLPYVASTSKMKYAFDAVIMDEKRILGLKKDFWGFAESVEIMHIG